MTVLVTAASKHGATLEIAEAIARALEEHGVSAELVEIDDVRDLGGYDAFVVGSGIYLGNWLKEARRFVDDHAAEDRALVRSRKEALVGRPQRHETWPESLDLFRVCIARYARLRHTADADRHVGVGADVEWPRVPTLPGRPDVAVDEIVVVVRYKSGTVRGCPDRRPIAVSKSTGLPVRVTRPPVVRMTQRWNGEITLPITQTPARVLPILLRAYSGRHLQLAARHVMSPQARWSIAR